MMILLSMFAFSVSSGITELITMMVFTIAVVPIDSYPYTLEPIISSVPFPFDCGTLVLTMYRVFNCPQKREN